VRSTRFRAVMVLGCIVAAFAPVAAAEAAFPGANGRIAFASDRAGTFDIWSMNPDGSDPVQLTDGPAYDNTPVWSPDGRQIAFTREFQVWVMNADGSGESPLTSSPLNGNSPAWSPDGSRIAFTSRDSTGDDDIWVMDSDGTDAAPILSGPEDDHTTAWAPHGRRIAFNTERYGQTWVMLVNPDGTHVNGFGGASGGLDGPAWSPDAAWIAADNAASILKINTADRTQRVILSPPPSSDFRAAWSPDGHRIAFFSNRDPGSDWEIWTMTADGADLQQVTSNESYDFNPDWQPIPINVYPRPKGAGLTRVSLTPALAPCTAPNRTHGPPLAFGSCAPPAQRSGDLTIGTPDANDNPAKSLAYLLFDVQAGLTATQEDEADVTLRGEVTDVRRSSNLADYGGDLEARVGLTITDRDNTPSPGGPGAATTVEIPFSIQMPCAVTADATVGSTCSIDTTADALAPATVKEGDRSVWQLGAVEVRDAAGAVFMTQGVFVP
jgi:Tol biopolymer transport system component